LFVLHIVSASLPPVNPPSGPTCTADSCWVLFDDFSFASYSPCTDPTGGTLQHGVSKYEAVVYYLLVLFTGVIFSYYLGIVICVIGAFNIML
jgi:hypothetical protein